MPFFYAVYYLETSLAIGSSGEIGTVFSRWGDKTPEQQAEWFKYMSDEWGSYLMNGYATLVHIKEGNPFYDKNYNGRRITG